MKIIIIFYLIYFISMGYCDNNSTSTITNYENIITHVVKVPFIFKIWIFTEILMYLL